MEETIQIKPELKEEYILPLVGSGVDTKNITTVKKEEENFIEALVNVTKEEKFPAKFDAETKPNVTYSLVKSCSELDFKNYQGDKVEINVNEGKSKEENNKNECCIAEISNEADSEKIIEGICPINDESEETDGGFEELSGLQNVHENPASPLHSNPVQIKKRYIKERKYLCKYCEKRFSDSRCLRRHIRTHTGERPYECSFCCKHFTTKSLLRRHSVIHTGKPFCCPVCGKHLSKNLKDHLLIHEGKKPFKCAQCPMAFRQRSAIITHSKRVHMRSQEPEETYLDDVTLDSNGSLGLEYSVEHGKSGDFSNSYKCHDKGNTYKSEDVFLAHMNNFTCNPCGKTFKHKESIVSHMKNSHIQEENLDDVTLGSNCSLGAYSTNSFICDHCGKTFKHKGSIVSHMKNVHIQEENFRYCCRICGFASSSKRNLKIHQRVHETVYSFKCKYCNMSFKHKLNLKTHLVIHVPGKPYKCVDCGSSFRTKSYLKAHNEVHHSSTTTKEFTCNVCNMQFKIKSYLKRHVETHTNADKKYICDNCGLGCRSKADIAKHVLTHIGAVEKPFICKVCGLGFGKRSHLSRHSRVHSDQRAFKCEICDKAYKDPSSLKVHCESIHIGASFACQVCGFRSINRHSFKRHLRQCQN